MENIILTYGLDDEQFDLLKGAVPEYYALEAAETVVDFMATNTVCNVICAEKLSQDSLNILLHYYLDILDVIAERVVWIGAIELPKELQNRFARYNTFQDMLLNIAQIIKQAQSHYDIQQMYLCPFAYLPGRGIEHALEQDIFNSLHKKYGVKPDLDIQKRLRQEWTALLETNAINELAAVYELSLWLKQNNHPFRVSGNALSGFIPYLLSITDVNPLQAHYHCPNCNHFEWKYESNFGFDLREKSCPHCGTNMDRDGFDLIWQEYASYGRVPIYTVYLPDDLQPQIVSWANEHWLKKWRPEDWQIKQPVESQLSVGNFLFRFELNRNQISTNFHSRIVTAEDKVQLIQEGPHKELFEKVHFPLKVDLEEYVALLCVKKQSCAVKELANIVLLNGIRILSLDFPCCREDIFYYLKAHDFEDKDAFRGMTSVRKGRGLPVITDEMRAVADSWIAEYCGHIDWLPSRAEIISELFINLKSRHEVE